MFNPVAHSELFLDGINKASGMEIEELAAICGLIKKYQPKTILEIGTKHGRTAINMAQHSPDDCRIFCVDIKHLNHSNIACNLVFTKLRFITADSLVFNFHNLKAGLFDFILVDGNHMAQWVRNDTLKALDTLKSGGVIVWHDYGKAPKYTTIQVKATLTEMGIFPIVIPGTSLAYMVKE